VPQRGAASGLSFHPLIVIGCTIARPPPIPTLVVAEGGGLTAGASPPPVDARPATGPDRQASLTGPARRDILSSSFPEVAMRVIETEEAARRLARAIASDLSLYNEDKILEGLQADNLYESLAEEIQEGRQLFTSRVTPELFGKNFYDRAIIDLLIKSKGHIKCKLW
jgi:hypothetical protein